MDLSYLRFEHDASVAILPPDLAVLMVGVAARQAASPTAMFQAHLAPAISADSIFFPQSGAFDAAVAAQLRRWRRE